MKITSFLVLSLLSASVAACNDSSTAPAHVRPNAGTPLTFAQAQTAASSLGAFLQPIVTGVDARAQGGGIAERRAAFADTFGPAVATSLAGTVMTIDGAIRYDSETGTATTVEGAPALVLWSLSGGAFFYEPTIVDVGTGVLYQGSFEGSEDGGKFFGPLVPGVSARIVGNFEVEQLSTLDGLIRQAISGNQG